MNAPTLELRLKALRLPSFAVYYAGLAEQAVEGWLESREVPRRAGRGGSGRAYRATDCALDERVEVAARQDACDAATWPASRRRCVRN